MSFSKFLLLFLLAAVTIEGALKPESPEFTLGSSPLDTLLATSTSSVQNHDSIRPGYEQEWALISSNPLLLSTDLSAFKAYINSKMDDSGALALPNHFFASTILPTMCTFDNVVTMWDGRVCERSINLLMWLHDRIDILRHIYDDRNFRLIRSDSLYSLVLMAVAMSTRGFGVQFLLRVARLERDGLLMTWIRNYCVAIPSWKECRVFEGVVIDNDDIERLSVFESLFAYNSGYETLFANTATSRSLFTKTGTFESLFATRIDECELKRYGLVSMLPELLVYSRGEWPLIESIISWHVPMSKLVPILHNLPGDCQYWAALDTFLPVRVQTAILHGHLITNRIHVPTTTQSTRMHAYSTASGDSAKLPIIADMIASHDTLVDDVVLLDVRGVLSRPSALEGLRLCLGWRGLGVPMVMAWLAAGRAEKKGDLDDIDDWLFF